MIRETSLFLSWALARERGLPRIPRQPVAQGGFKRLLAQPGGRALAYRWWERALVGSWHD